MTLATGNIPIDQDISSIATGEWADHEFPLGPRERPTRRCVIFKQSVLNDIRAHGRDTADIEVCGVLVGNVYRDAMGPFVFVEASIRGNFSAGKNAQVTFTAATWSHIQDVMDRQYPDLRILGWYHTHPGHGIFLSDMDLFIHKNFFSLPWHLAFVFDPQHNEEGLFAWRMGNMAVESFVVQKDTAPDSTKVMRRLPDAAPQPIIAPPPSLPGDTAVAAQTVTTNAPALPGATQVAVETHGPVSSTEAEPVTAAPAADATPAAEPAPAPQPVQPSYAQIMELKDISLRLQQMEKRQRWMTAGLAVMVLVAVAWPLALAGFAVLHDKPPSPVPTLGEPEPAHASEAPLRKSARPASPADRDRTAAAQP